MRRLLAPAELPQWLDDFFPGLGEASLGNLLAPAKVSDITDGQLIHLAGLNLNRAWTMQGIASALPKRDRRAVVLGKGAKDHHLAGLAYVKSGHYEGEHWLASFAVYLMGGSGLGFGSWDDFLNLENRGLRRL
jgi:hypothetical protein